MQRYCIGGLEPKETDRFEIMPINGVNYVLSEKFKSKLLANILDWETFLEIYNNNIDKENMLNQIIKLLDIKEVSSLLEVMLPLLKKIYLMPAMAHISCMMKQFMVYEPLSIAVRELFTAIRQHYENIVELFIKTRNNYINQYEGGKPNDFHTLLDKWNTINGEQSLESSSVILLLFNHKKFGIHFTIKCNKKNIKNIRKECHNADKLCNVLKAECRKFKYMGFCPKVPYKRLAALLQFPIASFVRAIKAMDETVIFPNYNLIEKQIATALVDKPQKPHIKDIIKRETPNNGLLKQLNEYKRHQQDEKANEIELSLIKWYVSKILDLRKQLLDEGKKYEEYFIQNAKQINAVTEIVKGYLSKVNFGI